MKKHRRHHLPNEATSPFGRRADELEHDGERIEGSLAELEMNNNSAQRQLKARVIIIMNDDDDDDMIMA